MKILSEAECMKNNRRDKVFLILGFITVLVGGGLYFEMRDIRQAQNKTVAEKATEEIVTYKGESNTNALVLLKEKASIELDKSGMVIVINSRKADTAKREYWSFYVNGKPAPVGAADYVTKDSDIIEWKIEKY